MEPKNVKWLIAHEPQHLFLRTANAFAEEMEKLTKGAVKIEVLTASDYSAKYGKEIDAFNVLGMVESGEVEMTQTKTVYFSRWEPNYHVLDMPFLFKNHDHATKVLEGSIGKSLRNNLTKNSNMKGLGFTYSGGYRIIGSKRPITSFEDFQNLRIRVNPNPVNSDFMNSIGASPMKTTMKEGYGYDKIDSGDLDAVESTYLRFQGTHILKTNHSMFLTCIAMNKTFFESLDPSIQSAVEHAALVASRLERQWSIEDAEKFEKTCLENGIEIRTLSEEDQNKLMTLSQQVYEKYEDKFFPKIFDYIRKQQ